MNIGFIGLGGMGRPMAGHLLAAGHALTVWSRRPASADFLPPDVVRAASPAELARRCEIVCTNVTGSEDVEGLAALGCRRFQGYLFARPQPADNAALLLAPAGME